jgi:DNA-binding transcriptional regulator YiaG
MGGEARRAGMGMDRKEMPKPMAEGRKHEIAEAMGKRIAQGRREAGFRTAQDFADALEVSVWTVRSWESGKSQPRYEMLETVSALTGRARGWFLGEEPLRDRLQITIGDLLAGTNCGENAEGVEAGVYGIPARDGSAERALLGLSEAARTRSVLIRFGTPIPPAATEAIAALHVAVMGLAGSSE